jgi:hypothetical protein
LRLGALAGDIPNSFTSFALFAEKSFFPFGCGFAALGTLRLGGELRLALWFP